MLETATLSVTGMKCGGCENNVITKLKSFAGMASVTASSKERVVVVTFEPEKMNLEQITQAIESAGYKVENGA